jgi:hypothetical protein
MTCPLCFTSSCESQAQDSFSLDDGPTCHYSLTSISPEIVYDNSAIVYLLYTDNSD